MNYDQLRIVLEGSRCNLRCGYCLAGYTDQVKAGPAQINEEAILRQTAPHSFSSISLWGGEPFYNFAGLRAVVAFCERHYPDLPIYIISNGTAFTEEAMVFINRHQLRVALSHDAFAHQVRGRDYLMDAAYRELIKRIDGLGFSTVIHRGNCDFSEIFRYFEALRDTLGCDFSWGFELYQLSDTRDLAYLPDRAALERFDRSLDFLLDKFEQGHPFAYSALMPTLGRMAKTADAKAAVTCRCGADNRMTVTTGGRTAFCQVAVETGNFAPPVLKLPPGCQGCHMAWYCAGICPLADEGTRRQMCAFYKLYYTKLYAFLQNLGMQRQLPKSSD